MWPNGNYPLNLNDPCWEEDYPPEQIELFKRQRIERGFADPDWWDMCDYLCQFLPKLFEALSEHGHGAPPEMTIEEWRSALHTMAQHFRDAYDLKGIDLSSEMISSIIDQAEEKKEMNPVLKTIRPELLEAYKNGGQEGLNQLNNLLNTVSDSELDQGFKDFKQNFWALWD